MPTIRQWMHEYNRLATIANERGLSVRLYTNLRVSNEEARARVESLAARLGTPLLIGMNRGSVPDPLAIVAPRVQPRIRSLRSRRRRFYAAPSYPAVARATAGISCNYPDGFDFDDMVFGVEIECMPLASVDNYSIARLFETAGLSCRFESLHKRTTDYWRITTDGSVGAFNPPPRGHRGQFEVVSPKVPGRDLNRQVGIAGSVLNGSQAHAQVNMSCGLHVHIGLTPQVNNLDFFKRLVRLMVTHEKHIDSVVAPSRRANNASFAKSLAPYASRMLAATDIGSLISAGPGKYCKLNLQPYSSRGTIEFRQHQGTTDPQKIEMWARLCARIYIAAARGVEAQSVNSLGEFLSQINVTESERTFFEARFAALPQN